MRPKGIAVIVAVSVVIILVVIFPVTPNSIPPGIQDEPEVDEGVDVSSTTEDSLAVKESTAMEKETIITYFTNEQGVRYYIDENGLKHYDLSTNDTPNFGES